MASKRALEDRVAQLEQALRVVTVQQATLMGVLASRLTNLELFWKVRRTMNQAEAVVVLPGSFSHEGFERVSTQVRDEILAVLMTGAEEEAAEGDVPARTAAGGAD